METFQSLLDHVKNSNNPAIYYVVAAIALLVFFMVMRSLLATAIMVSGIAVVILIILVATGQPLPKVDLTNLKLPDLSGLSSLFSKGKDPSSTPPEQNTGAAAPGTGITVPAIPGTTQPSSDPLKDAIIQGRKERAGQGGFNLGF